MVDGTRGLGSRRERELDKLVAYVPGKWSVNC